MTDSCKPAGGRLVDSYGIRRYCYSCERHTATLLVAYEVHGVCCQYYTNECLHDAHLSLPNGSEITSVADRIGGRWVNR